MEGNTGKNAPDLGEVRKGLGKQVLAASIIAVACLYLPWIIDDAGGESSYIRPHYYSQLGYVKKSIFTGIVWYSLPLIVFSQFIAGLFNWKAASTHATIHSIRKEAASTLIIWIVAAGLTLLFWANGANSRQSIGLGAWGFMALSAWMIFSMKNRLKTNPPIAQNSGSTIQ